MQDAFVFKHCTLRSAQTRCRHCDTEVFCEHCSNIPLHNFLWLFVSFVCSNFKQKWWGLR